MCHPSSEFENFFRQRKEKNGHISTTVNTKGTDLSLLGAIFVHSDIMTILHRFGFIDFTHGMSKCDITYMSFI
jgi:hypothetical protein